jgi:thioesterase domain-containing protein
VGELYLGGAGVAHGYLNRPELTAERFLPDPFAKAQGARMYKTGDLARYLPDGNLVFMGRNDDQVKIRGFRVELGEIEARLVEHPQVREAVVIAVGGVGDDKRLVAYVVAEPNESLAQTLRDFLSSSLPEYMVPTAFVCMDSFPLTNNGKIDRRALPEPDSSSSVSGVYVAPQGETEVALATMWSDLLKVERVGRHDNFFILGGHSLLAVRLIQIVRSRFGADLKLHMLFSAPTLSGLALQLDGISTSDNQDDEYSVLIPLKPQGRRAPIFCVHPAPGLSWSYRNLAQYVHPEQPLYGLQSRGLDGKSPLASSMEEMTLDYIDHIRKIQPQGPYHILGWSFGGKVAHNMAVVLQSQGESVPLLAVMDTVPVHCPEEEVNSVSQDMTSKYDEYLGRLQGVFRTDDALALKRIVAPILINNGNLAEQFTPSVFSGDLLFFRTTDQEEGDMIDPACWRPYIRGRIETHGVDCSHLEMDTPGNMAVVGRIVAAWIEKLQ